MGTIMAMSGAYMAMVMAETSAASALALGAFNGWLQRDYEKQH